MKELKRLSIRSSFCLMVFLFSIDLAAQVEPVEAGFVQVVDGDLVRGGSPYRFMGTNYWQGMNLAAPMGGDEDRLRSELDQMKALGIRNLRILAASEGDSEMKYAIHPALQDDDAVYDDDLWLGLDILLHELAKREMTAVLVLGNFWTWSGGFPQYLKWSGAGEIPYPQEEGTSWQQFTDYSKQFYTNEEAQKMMEDHIDRVINRENHVTGMIYKDDPTIMAWELANEPRAYDAIEPFRKWTRRVSAYIRGLDSKHLICLGTEGNTATGQAGVNTMIDNDDENIDYITMHIWPQNWGWFDTVDPEKAIEPTLKLIDDYFKDHIEVSQKLNKPIVFEEFGIARDEGSFDPSALTMWRNRLYDYFFNKVIESLKSDGRVQGVNFWTYSGLAKPPRPGEYWQKGDVLTGDPPHELQGWYGVYADDDSTLEIIEKAAKQINN